ncbi:MAG TPA: hypothetical protein VEZ17_17770 [Chitinophagaceae bacterium]|jgi:Spy/CpxP family protein refolding chaperone|nr:hypothetical protein [Chitinophagaceae bacterium]
MKKLFTVFLFISGFALASIAQESTQTRDTRKGHFSKAKDDLKLSEDQDKKWQEIEEQFRSKMKTVRKDEAITIEEKKEQLRSLNMERMEQINAVLTPDQRQKWNQMKKEAHHKKRLNKEPASS